MGSSKIKISVEIEKPALAYQFLVRLIQVEWTDLSQAPLMGLHWKMEEKVVATMYARIIPIRT